MTSLLGEHPAGTGAGTGSAAPVPVRRRNGLRRRQALRAYGFIAPSVVILGAFMAWPLVSSLRLSFFESSQFGTDTFVGLDNYRSLLGDQVFRGDLFRTLLYAGFDVPYIGRWVLGRYWNSANDAQRTEYQKLFEQLIVNTYAERFVEYSGETFKITGINPAGEADSMVTTQIVRPNGPPVNVSWRVRKSGADYKIIDVVVENVSMGVTQRQEFASVIEQNGGRVDGLIQALRQKVGSRAG